VFSALGKYFILWNCWSTIAWCD